MNKETKNKKIKFKETTYPKTNFLTKEVLVLRRLRILKKIKRKKVAEALGVCVAVVDRFENGRTKISIERRNKLLKIYKISHDEFRKMTDGEIKIPDLSPHSVYEHKKEDLRRMYNKNVTKEARVLRVFRKMKGLSQSEAGALAGMHRRSIGHIENGRVEITKEKVKKLLPIYSKTLEDFSDYIKQDILRDEVIEICTKILEKIEHDKLKAVQALLTNF